MTTEQQERLTKIIKMSHRLHSMAEDGDWASMPELELERRSLIESSFGSGPHCIDIRSANDQVQEILQLDQALIDLAIKARETTKTELKQLQKGRSATNAYQQNSL